jgi:hypothetical protein
MAVRVSQTNKEIAGTSSSPTTRVTQANAEILSTDAVANARVTQANAEILSTQSSSNARVTQTSAEILSTQSNSNARVTQVNAEILVFVYSWMIYGMGPVDESSVNAPTVLLTPPPPPPVFYFYPSGGGKVLRYKPEKSAIDDRLLMLQRIWEDYARAAVEGQPSVGIRGLGSMGRISNGFRWLEFGRQRRPWMRQGSIVTPAPANGDTVVCEFEVPEGYYGWLSGFWWAYTGTGYIEGSTDIEWRIRIGDQYPEGYGRVRFQMGTPTDPLTITGMMPLRSRQKVRLIVFVKNDSGNIQVGSSRIIGGLRGWLYEPETGGNLGIRW